MQLKADLRPLLPQTNVSTDHDGRWTYARDVVSLPGIASKALVAVDQDLRLLPNTTTEHFNDTQVGVTACARPGCSRAPVLTGDCANGRDRAGHDQARLHRESDHASVSRMSFGSDALTQRYPRSNVDGPLFRSMRTGNLSSLSFGIDVRRDENETSTGEIHWGSIDQASHPNMLAQRLPLCWKGQQLMAFLLQ